MNRLSATACLKNVGKTAGQSEVFRLAQNLAATQRFNFFFGGSKTGTQFFGFDALFTGGFLADIKFFVYFVQNPFFILDVDRGDYIGSVINNFFQLHYRGIQKNADF